MNMQQTEDLKLRGEGIPASAEVLRGYLMAFERFGTYCLWNCRMTDHPTLAQAVAIAETLRREGNVEARALAIAIEDACNAAL